MTGREPPVEPVEIATDDGVALRGERWDGGDMWVVLLHDLGPEEDLDRWRPLLPHLADGGWTVLALDLRGHGASDGEWSVDRAVPDVAAALGFARARGATRVVVVAAGESAVAALHASATAAADALVLLSPAIDADQSVTDLRGTGEAKLIVVGASEAAPRRAAERLRNASIGWALLVNLPTPAQGTALLNGMHGRRVQAQVVRFLAEQRYLAANRAVLPGRSARRPTAAVEGKERDSFGEHDGETETGAAS